MKHIKFLLVVFLAISLSLAACAPKTAPAPVADQPAPADNAAAALAANPAQTTGPCVFDDALIDKTVTISDSTGAFLNYEAQVGDNGFMMLASTTISGPVLGWGVDNSVTIEVNNEVGQWAMLTFTVKDNVTCTYAANNQ